MAFPDVRSFTNGTSAGTLSTFSVTLPATIVAGDLIIIGVSSRSGVGGGVTATGFTTFYNNTQSLIVKKVAVGGEAGTSVSMVFADSPTTHSWFSAAIRDTSTGTTPATATALNTKTCPPLTPSWGLDDTLWLNFGGGTHGETLSAYPTGYTIAQGFPDVGGFSDVHSAHSFRKNATATETPTAHTMSGNFDRCGTIAFRPAAAPVSLFRVIIT